LQKQKQEAELALQTKKQEDERATLEFQKQKWQQEANLQQQQLASQEADRTARAALKDDTAAKIKKFGEALRNAVTRQPNDAWETPTFSETLRHHSHRSVCPMLLGVC